MYRCKSCNISTELFFCPHCGLILKYPQILEGDKNRKDILQSYIRDFVRKVSVNKVNVSAFSNKEFLTNAVLSKFNEHILFLQRSNSNRTLINNDKSQSVIQLLREFADKCKTTDCHIGVCGKIGAGKSTFINALLGIDVVRESLNSETTVLTKYRYSDSGNYIKLSYYKTHEWDSLWHSAVSANQASVRNDDGDYLSEFNRFSTDEIKLQLLNREDEVFYASSEAELKELVSKYISCESLYHYFIKEAEIGLTVYSMPKDVVVVDTLGIDDPVSYRVDFSNKYLNKSDIILLCVKADGHLLSSYELREYANLFSYVNDKQQLYIVGTQYDIPKDFAEYWNEKTNPEFIKYFAAKSYYNSDSAVKGRLLHTSAWYYNIVQKAKKDVTFWENEYNVDYLAEVLCRTLGTTVAYQYGTDANSLKKCMNEHIDKIESMTNLPHVLNCIVLGPIKDYERNSLNDLKNIYLKIGNTKHTKSHKNLNLYNSKLITRLIELDSKISRLHNEDDSKSKYVRKLIQSL